RIRSSGRHSSSNRHGPFHGGTSRFALGQARSGNGSAPRAHCSFRLLAVGQAVAENLFSPAFRVLRTPSSTYTPAHRQAAAKRVLQPEQHERGRAVRRLHHTVKGTGFSPRSLPVWAFA